MLTPEFVERLESGCSKFQEAIEDPLNDEYLLSTIIGEDI